jgi:hypothetical protein
VKCEERDRPESIHLGGSNMHKKVKQRKMREKQVQLGNKAARQSSSSYDKRPPRGEESRK